MKKLIKKFLLIPVAALLVLMMFTGLFMTSGTAHAASVQAMHAQTHASTPHNIKMQSNMVSPHAVTVACWLPHDVEVVNPDATWCLIAPGNVAIFHVSVIRTTGCCNEVYFGIKGDPFIQGVSVPLGQSFSFSSFDSPNELPEVVCITTFASC